MKILRNILLGILGAAVFLLLLPLLLLLLFAPLRYAVVAKVGGKTAVRAKASYLFSFFTVRYLLNEGKSTTQIRIAGVLLGKPKKKSDEAGEPPAASEAYTEEKQALPATISDEPEELEEADEDEAKSEPDEPRKSNRSAKSILTYPHLKTIIKLTLQCLKKTMKVILPKKFEIDGRVGFEDPASTGLVFGAYETVVGMLGLRDKIRLGADFAEPGIRMKIAAKGSISAARLSWPVIVLLCKKPIRDFIKFLRNKA